MTTADDFIIHQTEKQYLAVSTSANELDRNWVHLGSSTTKSSNITMQLFDSNNDLERVRLSARRERVHVISSYFFNKFNAILLSGPPPHRS